MNPTPEHPRPRRPRSRAGFRTDDVRKAVEGAIKGGFEIGRVDIVDGRISLIAVDGAASRNDADDLERRMREAFGSDDH